MLQKTPVSSLLLTMVMILTFAVAGSTVAMESGSKSHGHTKQGKMESKKKEGKKKGMHGSMGLTMTNIMPGKTMMFLDHFKQWIEVTSDQESAWGAFSKAIKLQATTLPHKKHMMHMNMQISPVAMAEMKIARAEHMIHMKRNTLDAYKALQQVLNEQQVQLADAFLAKHMVEHKGMKKGKGKGGH